MTDVVDAYAAERRAALAALRSVPAAEFDRITNCPPWTLAELVIHMAGSYRSVDLPTTNGAPDLVAADYYRRPERDTTEYRSHNVARVQRQAAEVLTRMSALEYFESTTAGFVDMWRGVDLAAPVEISDIGTMSYADWVLTRLIALAAHGLDAAITLGRPPWTDPAALRLVRPVFADLLGAEFPASLSDLDVLAVSTGRRPPEREISGELQDRFPLLS